MLPTPHGRRRLRLWPISSWSALLALTMMASCGEIGEPYLGAAPSTSTSTLDDDDGPVVENDETGPGAGTVVAQPSPPRPEGYEPTLVVSTDRGIIAGAPDSAVGLDAPLDALEALRSADDFFGGLVVQVRSGEVLWFPAEGGEGELVNDEGGSLLDVGFRDGTPEAILTGEANAIDRVQLVTRERLPLAVLPDGRQLLDLSASAGLFALVFADENCGGLVFLNSVGIEVDLSGPDEVPCPVPRRPAFGEIGLSPDGDAYVYTEIEYRSDGVEASTHLIGREFSTGAELFRIRVGEAGDRVRSVAFDGRRVAMLRSNLAEGSVDGLVVIDTTDPELVVPVIAEPANAVTYARLPVTVGSPVES